jgi:lactoylglutathione lyase
VADFEEALRFYRDALGLEQLADWSSESGRVVVLEAGRATLELLDEPQAEASTQSKLAAESQEWCASL